MVRDHIIGLICVAAGMCMGGCPDGGPGEACQDCPRPAAIVPDYCDVTLPVNIAPINFVIQQAARRYYVRIWSDNGEPILIHSRSSAIRIPLGQWRRVLGANRGGVLRIQVHMQGADGLWTRFAPITARIAQEPIDPVLVYRLMRPLFIYSGKMGLYQRDLTSFEERPILVNRATGGNCMNCHSFHNYDPNRMIFHMRSGPIGTYMILAYDGQLLKVDTKTAFNHATSYRCWHPNGCVIAFAFNTVRQVFHAVGHTRDVYDRASDLLLYDVGTKTITTCPQISSLARMETYPEWSPDGKYLYFCSGPAWVDVNGYDQPHRAMRYDLMRIPYDANSSSWGQVETVLSSDQTGLSLAHPRISPDGRYLLICGSECTYFPLYRPESDLYLLDIQTGEFWRADPLNSDRAEGYHSWSSNGRWVAFSTKRQDGQSTHLCISYFDPEGRFHKPFAIPQRDPQYHRMQVVVYNVPEFVKAPVGIRPQELIKVVWSLQVVPSALDPKVPGRAGPAGQDLPYHQVLPR